MITVNNDKYRKKKDEDRRKTKNPLEFNKLKWTTNLMWYSYNKYIYKKNTFNI